MKPQIGISGKNRQAVVRILNTLLADEYVLYTQTRKFHWNGRARILRHRP